MLRCSPRAHSQSQGHSRGRPVALAGARGGVCTHTYVAAEGPHATEALQKQHAAMHACGTIPYMHGAQPSARARCDRGAYAPVLVPVAMTAGEGCVLLVCGACATWLRGPMVWMQLCIGSCIGLAVAWLLGATVYLSACRADGLGVCGGYGVCLFHSLRPRRSRRQRQCILLGVCLLLSAGQSTSSPTPCADALVPLMTVALLPISLDQAKIVDYESLPPPGPSTAVLANCSSTAGRACGVSRGFFVSFSHWVPTPVVLLYS